MERDAVDDENSLEHLKRRAFSNDGEDALAARRELAGLEPAPAPPAEPDPVELPSHTRPPRWLVGGLAAALSITPRPSMDIFYRPATAIDVAMQERVPQRFTPLSAHSKWGGASINVSPIVESARWIAKSQGYDILAYRGDGADTSGPVVCVSVNKLRVNKVTCVPEEEFTKTGIQHSSQTRPIDKVIFVTVLWGPTGDARVFDRPLDEVAPR